MNRLITGLIGSHIQRSRLPHALDEMSREAGLNISFELIDSANQPDFDFAKAVTDRIERGWTGVSVTHPFKTDAAAFAGEGMSPALPAAIGASNLLVFESPVKCHNTDYTGFLDMWRAIAGNEMPGNVAMAGAGGVARALAFALAELGASDLAIWDTVPERAESLAKAVGGPARAIPLSAAISASHAADGLVNATAIGMAHAPGLPFHPDAILGQHWVFDAIYTPSNTEFLKLARASGIFCLTGFDLFAHMALATFTTFTGLVPDRKNTLARLRSLQPANA